MLFVSTLTYNYAIVFASFIVFHEARCYFNIEIKYLTSDRLASSRVLCLSYEIMSHKHICDICVVYVNHEYSAKLLL